MEPSRARLHLLIAAAASVALIMAVQGIVPALPAAQRALGISDSAAGWFTTAYVLPGVVLTVPLGLLGERVGLRAMFGGSLVVYGVAGAVQPLLSSYVAIVALRAVQGACFAVAMPLTVPIIARAHAAQRQVTAFAVRQTTITAGEFALPLIGTLLATISWKVPLLAQALAVPLGVAAWVVLEDDARTRGMGRAGDVWAVVRAHPTAVVVLLIGFTRFLFKFLVIAYVPLLVVRHLGGSVTTGGLIVTIAAAATGLTATQVPRLLSLLPASRLLCGAALVIAAALLGFALSGSVLVAVPIALLFGIGDGILAVLQDGYLVKTWAPEDQAIASSLSQTARNVGKVAAPAAMTTLLAVMSFGPALVAMAAVALVLAGAFGSLRRLDLRFAPAIATPSSTIA